MKMNLMAKLLAIMMAPTLAIMLAPMLAIMLAPMLNESTCKKGGGVFTTARWLSSMLCGYSLSKLLPPLEVGKSFLPEEVLMAT